jgi:hypothetical protein
MPNTIASDKYIEQAKTLSKSQVEFRLMRIRSEFGRKKIDPTELLHALALQLEHEDEDLQVWRERFAEVSGKYNKYFRDIRD